MTLGTNNYASAVCDISREKSIYREIEEEVKKEDISQRDE